MAADRAPRRTKEILRAMCIAEGVAMLLERGLEGGANHVTLADVFNRLEAQGQRVTRASVYSRIWDTQAAFQQDLLLAAAAYYPDQEEQPTLEQARSILDRADLTTPTGRAKALHNVCRTAADVHVAVLEKSRAWQIWVGIWALTVSTPTDADDKELGPAIEAGHHRAVAALEAVLREVMERVGYTLRPQYTYEQFTLAVSALAEGMALRNRFGPAVLVDAPPNAPSEGSRSLFSVGFEALVNEFTSPGITTSTEEVGTVTTHERRSFER